MVKSQLYKRSYAKELLKIAGDDYRSALFLKQDVNGRKETVCFLAQQAIEKALKSVICYYQRPIPFTHSLETLGTFLPPGFDPPNFDNIKDLSEYATIRRYEEGMAELADEDLEAVLGATKDILDWAAKLIP